MKTAIFAFLLAFPALAQTPPGVEMAQPGFAQLIRYLDLSPQQIAGLTRLEMDFMQFVNGKQRRANAVEEEIREMTLAPVLDPAGLGVRYAELELICRDCRAKDDQTRVEARKLMTPAQISRLDVLEQAHKLMPIIGQADAVHLLDAPVPALNLASIIQRFPGCRYREPLFAFTPAPIITIPNPTQPGIPNPGPQ